MTSSQAVTHWEHFSHGSDIGVRGFGESAEEAFANAAVAAEREKLARRVARLVPMICVKG